MRKAILLTAAAAFLAVPAVVEAQEASATGTIETFAELTAFIAVTGELPVQFGDVATGSTINRQAALGRFHIEHSHNVAFTFDASELTYRPEDGEEDADWTITPAWACEVTNNDEFAAGNENENLGACTGRSATGSEDPRAEVYFYVGGNIDGGDLVDHPFGDYEGTITLTATQIAG
jgi:hypothetical protein